MGEYVELFFFFPLYFFKFWKEKIYLQNILNEFHQSSYFQEIALNFL